MEDGLVHFKASAEDLKKQVLILIVVEDGLVPPIFRVQGDILTKVLILIVVEDGLVHYKKGAKRVMRIKS